MNAIKEGDRLTVLPRGKNWGAYFDSRSRGSLPARSQPPLETLSIGALLFAAALALACGAPTMSQLKALVRASFPGVPQMSIEELDRRLEEAPAPLVIDVREHFEYAVSHLPGAVQAQGEDIVGVIAAAAPDRPVVLYCSVGYRSSAAVADLIQLHDPDILDRVWNLEGSIFEWANSGRPVYRGDVEVDRVHPYDSQWGKLLEPHLRP